MMRTDRAGDLRATDIGRDVVLCGWVDSRRDHGGVLFLDVRDTAGIVQVVVDPEVVTSTDVHRVRGEYVVQVQGQVRHRPDGTVNDSIRAHRVLELQYYKENEDDFVKREVEPYQLVKGPEGWYLGCYDLGRSDTRHFRLDRMKEAAITEREFEPREGVDEALAEQEWLVHGEVGTAGVARVWVSPNRARWLREERTVTDELSDGAVVVELPYGSTDWLVREVLKGVGDLVVLEPDDARDAVLQAVSGK